MELSSAPCSTRREKKKESRGRRGVGGGLARNKRYRKLLLFVPAGVAHSLSPCGKVCGDFLPQTSLKHSLGMGGDSLEILLFMCNFKHCIFLLFVSS